jgi:hypothetical protein
MTERNTVGAERVKLGAWARMSPAEQARVREQRHQESLVAAGVTRVSA